MLFSVIVLGIAVVAGGIASIAGFGIGSLLTPVIGFAYGIKLAVAAVSIPHLIATAIRFIMVRRHVNKSILISFGLMSAIGGLCGALLHSVIESQTLSIILGVLLAFIGASEITGLSAKFRISGWIAWPAGIFSGLLGGLVGNQGGIRSTTLLSFEMPKESFVATATAIALIVDAARMPVYFITQLDYITGIWPIVLIATLGTAIGTIAGQKVLERIPEPVFRTFVSTVILALGIALILGLGG